MSNGASRAGSKCPQDQRLKGTTIWYMMMDDCAETNARTPGDLADDPISRTGCLYPPSPIAVPIGKWRGKGFGLIGYAGGAVAGRMRDLSALRTPISPCFLDIGGVWKLPFGTYEKGCRCGGGCSRSSLCGTADEHEPFNGCKRPSTTRSSASPRGSSSSCASYTPSPTPPSTSCGTVLR